MIITITALKGGVGKTTTAVHLAAYCQERAPTLLIDADRNRSALVWSKEEKLSFRVASEAGSHGLIKKYHHILIDTKVRPEPEDLKDSAEGSDLLIIPTTPNALDIDATLKAAEILEPLKANFKVLLTKVDSRTRNGREARKSLEEQNLPMFAQDIPQLVAFERASSRGMLIKDYSDPRSRMAWEKYKAVGGEVLP
ncbi:MAG: chromosome partitioning protein ParA [Cyanobacteria bacterium QS_4_48_99]|nr:MAG: chromosome partitioning protein ParA [Cyanobacteria bacterium QS_4_48_99]